MRSRRRRKNIVVPAIIVVVLFALVGFFVLPPIVKGQLEKQMTAQLGRTVTVGKVHINPFALSLALDDLEVREKGGPNSFVGWKRLYVRFDAIRSIVGDWVLADIELDGFHADVTVNHDGSFNFSDLLAKFAPPAAAPAKPGRAVRISNLSVTEAKVRFVDLTPKHAFSTVVGPLSFNLTGFRTAGSSGAPYHFETTTEAGESLSWNGTLVAEPFSSSGNFRLKGIVLKKYAPYLEALSRADVTDGQLALQGSYVVVLDPKARTLQVSGAGLSLHNIKVVERAGQKPVAEVTAIDVEGFSADAVSMKASVDKISMAGGHALVRRDADGSLNLLSLLNSPAPAPSPGAMAPAATPAVTVGEVSVSGFKVDVVDDSLSHPAHLGLGNLEASIKGFTLAKGAVMPVHASFAWAPKGTVLVDGTMAIAPVIKAEVKATINRFELLPLSPYIEQFVNARITEGSVSTISTARVALASGKPAIDLSGDLSVDKFGLVDAARNKELAGFSWLAIAGMEVRSAPGLSVMIKQVDVDGPYARVRVNPDKTLNILSVMKPPGAAQAASPMPLPKIQVGKVVLDDGDFSYSDQSINPSVRVSLTGFGGSVTGLSSENFAKADVDLKGLVGGVGPVQISGKLDPLGAHRYVALKIGVRSVDLVPLSPYSGKFAGYDLARGQLVVDSNVLVDGDKVDATNVVTLNQFTFGSPTSSPDATGLPVRLGVALLKDTDGKIVIDLPVQGTLGDPNFRIGKVVLRVIINILTKAAVSPFALVGSMFGGGGQELAFQEFAPGSSELQASEIPKLDTLAKVLRNRPALSLGLQGDFDAAADAYALKRVRLADLVRRQVWEARHAVDPNIPAPDRLQVTAEEKAAMVKKMFDAKFPPGTQFGTPLPPPPVVTPPPAPPTPGLIQRVVAIITFKAQRDEKAARVVAEKRDADHNADVRKAVDAGLPQDEMEGRLAEAIAITDSDLAGLAAARAQSVRNYLASTGHIPVERLFLSKAAASASKGPRVELSLE
jgi:hypothetical protein